MKWIGVAVIVVLLVAACAQATPTPTATPTATLTPTATPTPTPIPTPTRAPVPTIVPEPIGQSNLLRLLERVPISWTEEGVWFNDWGRALDMARAPRPCSWDEFVALSQEQKDAYQAPLSLKVFALGPDVRETARNYAPEWGPAFGFDHYQMDMAIGTGRGTSDYGHPAYIEGGFDAETVHKRLLDLGYEERQAVGYAYYADIAHRGIKSPIFLTTIDTDHMYIDDNTLVTAPRDWQMEEIIEVWSGDSPPLIQDPAFSSLGETLWDALSAAILSRALAFDTSYIGEDQRPQFKKQETWGTLHEWEAVGFGAGRKDDGTRWVALSIYYPDMDAAVADISEMVHRLETYEASVWPELLTRGYPEYPWRPCGPITVGTSKDDRGSTLTIKYIGECFATGERTPIGWWEMIDLRDLGFLVP